MTSCRIIVLEKTGRWAAAFRGQRLEGLPPVVETRTLPELRDRLAQSPHSLVALAATTGNLAALPALIGEIRVRNQHSAPVILLDALLGELSEKEIHAAASLYREAGAVDIVTSVVEAPRLARLACRLAAQAPHTETTLQQFIDQTLPWPPLATRQWMEATG